MLVVIGALLIVTVMLPNIRSMVKIQKKAA